MGQGLSHFARLFLAGRAGFDQAVGGPVLLWEAATGAASGGESWQPTAAGHAPGRPRLGEPMVFLIQKSQEKRNPFGMGVTLGRVLHNDIVVDDASISRFHAWFQQDPRSGHWTVADAESMNGSHLNGLPLPPNVRQPIQTRAALRFGDVDMTFLDPQGLWDVIQSSR